MPAALRAEPESIVNTCPATVAPLRPVRAAAAVVLALAAWGGAQAQDVPAAGRVVFVSGPAQLLAADGSARPLTAGAGIRQGEQITTGADGYVHVRMVDNGFVAVRPASRLLIALYEYDAANPAASRIKLQLHNGNTRTVSGKGGEAAKQNYRFNTPMAAIGLRGTDYTVVSTPDATRVSVARGAVAVTPLGEGCSAAALGPCATPTTRELAAGLSHAYMEVTAQNRAPVLVRPEQDPQGGNGQNPPGRPGEPTAENQSELKLASTKEAASQVTADKLASGIDLRPTPPAVPAPPAEPPRPAQLVWGRWSQFAGTEGSPMVADIAAGRESWAGNSVFALLGPRIGTVTLPLQGSFSFDLAASEAYTLADGKLSAAQVLGGTLNIDFQQRAFDTALAVQHGGGTERLSAQGRVQHQGFLLADPARSNMALSGAIAQGGTEAAYLFEKSLASGGLLGAVRWVR